MPPLLAEHQAGQAIGICLLLPHRPGMIVLSSHGHSWTLFYKEHIFLHKQFPPFIQQISQFSNHNSQNNLRKSFVYLKNHTYEHASIPVKIVVDPYEMEYNV